MARVPTYTPGVGAAPLPQPRVQPTGPSGLGDIGRGLQQVGQAGLAIADDARRQAEAIQITGFKAGMEEDWTTLFHDDQDGFRRLKGEAAFGGEQALLDEMNRRVQTRLEGISSPTARQRALLESQQVMASYRRQTEQYIGQQREVAAGASLAARKATALDALALGYADPAERARLTGDVEASIRALAVSAEAGDAAVADWHKQADALVIRRYLDDKDAAGAKAYFAQARDRLGKDAGRISREIDAVSRDGDAERLALSLVEKHTGENGRVDGDAALAAVDEIENVDLREDVRKRVDHRALRGQQAWQRKVAEQVNLAISQYETGGDSLAAIDPRIKAWMLDPQNGAAAEWRKLEQMARSDGDYWRRRSKEGSGKGASPDEVDAYGRFVLDLVDRPEVYRTMSEEELRAQWRTQLPDSLYKQAVQRLASHRQDKEAVVGDQKRMVESALESGGITRAEEKDAFWLKFDNWLQAEKARPERSGRAPTHKELQDWIGREVEDVVTKGRVFGTNKQKRFLADPEKITATTPADIPATDKQRLIREYRQKVGNPNAMPSDDLLLRAYRHELTQARAP